MPMSDRITVSESSRLLDALLSEGGDVAALLVATFHRTTLWRLRTGRRRPEMDTANDIARITHGRVPVTGWVAKRSTRAA